MESCSPGAGAVEVIPCCADLEHFRRDKVSPEARARWQHELKLTDEDFVVSYLGSLGTWYLVDEMLRFFKELLQITSRGQASVHHAG